MWKSVRPFKGGFDQVTAEGFDSGKFNPKITGTQVNEMADEIRHHISKSHVQDWANDNHLIFIKNYISLERRSDLSYGYGYVWELKCRHFEALSRIARRPISNEAKNAF